MRLPLRLVPALVAALLWSGCASYHLGAPGQPLVSTVFVAPATNAAFAPQAASLVTNAVRLALSRDGRIELAAHAADDAGTLQIRLVGYDRDVLAAQRDDTGLARKFAVTLSAEITLTDASGKTLLDHRKVVATRDVFVDSGLQPAEYQTMPLLAEALADEIAHALLDTW